MVYELAAQFGIARQTDSTHLKRCGVTMRMRGLDESQRPEVEQLRVDGMSYARIGERFDVDATTVLTFMRRS